MRTTGMKTVAGTSLILATWLFVLAGCDDSELQQAKQEAARAKADVNRLELRLQRADKMNQDLKSDISKVREMRDALNDRVNQLAKEKEKVSTLAAQAQQTATTLAAKADSEADTMTSLKERVAQLQNIVAAQQATIDRQQATLEQVQQYVAQEATAVQTTTTTGDTAATSGTNQSQSGTGSGQ